MIVFGKWSFLDYSRQVHEQLPLIYNVTKAIFWVLTGCAFSGQLSSVLGPKTLTMDRVFRTLGLAWRAKNDIALLQKKYVQRIEAFAAGNQN